MGIFSVSKSSRSSSSTQSVTVATLGGAQVSLTLLEKLLDGTPIPFVKGAVGTALEVIKLAKAIQSDKEDCDNLIKRTTSLLIIILDSLKGKTEEEIPSHLKDAVERLSTNFHEVLNELKIIDKRVGKRGAGGITKAILYHFDNTEKLKGCSSKLEWAIAEFEARSRPPHVTYHCLWDSCAVGDIQSRFMPKGSGTLRRAAQGGARKSDCNQGRPGLLQEGQAKIEAKIEDGQTKIQDGQAKLQEGLDEIWDVVKDKISGGTPLSLPSTVMPANPRIFGRQMYINKVIQLIFSATSTRVAILGSGGMGKTSVALKTVHDSRIIERFGINRRWVPCEQATSVPLFFELIAKSLGLSPSTSNDRFSEIVAALEKSDTLQFVLFDNFETIWDIEGEQSVIANILSRLASIPSVSFIITMRGIQHPASDLIDWTSPRLPPLTPLEMDPAQEAFVRISPDSEGDPHLPELLRELDCMPLAITLMAKLAEVGETIMGLLSQWRREQVKLLSQPGGDRTSSIEVSIRLSLMSSPVRMNEDAIPLLSVLARLPGGASLAQLPTICPSITGWKAALRILRTAALVYDSPDKTVVHMLSPIRAYVLLHHPIADGPLQDLRNAYYQLADKGYTYHGDPNLDDVLAELSKEEINLDTIILDALRSADNKEGAISAATGYSSYLNLTQPRVNIMEEAIRAARGTGSTQLASCLNRYGDILRFQSQYDAASVALEEAAQRHLRMGYISRAAYSLWSIGDILLDQNVFDEACSKVEEARRLFIEVDDLVGAADSLFLLGNIYEAQGKFDIAISTLEESRSQFTQLGAGLGPANCLRLLGTVYCAQGQYEAAFSAATEAKLAYTELRSLRGTAHTLLLMGDIHFDQGQYSEAYSAAEEARSGYSGLGDKLGIAGSLTLMGNILIKQGRYDEVHPFAEDAKNMYITAGDLLGIADSLTLIGDAYLYQGKIDMAYSALQEAKSRFTQCNCGWYGSMRLADCNRALGKTYRLRGQYDNAIKVLQDARTVYSTQSRKKSYADECTEEIELALKERDNHENVD
ncbi:hypothetical protein FRC02_008336 [Tulasnella sp. 418]|nr:hypothetical protein FRC02_008336 [Tulasnella sp. 418]